MSPPCERLEFSKYITSISFDRVGSTLVTLIDCEQHRDGALLAGGVAWVSDGSQGSDINNVSFLNSTVFFSNILAATERKHISNNQLHSLSVSSYYSVIIMKWSLPYPLFVQAYEGRGACYECCSPSVCPFVHHVHNRRAHNPFGSSASRNIRVSWVTGKGIRLVKISHQQFPRLFFVRAVGGPSLTWSISGNIGRFDRSWKMVVVLAVLN